MLFGDQSSRLAVIIPVSLCGVYSDSLSRRSSNQVNQPVVQYHDLLHSALCLPPVTTIIVAIHSPARQPPAQPGRRRKPPPSAAPPAMASTLMASSASKSLVPPTPTTPKPKPVLLPRFPLLTLPPPPAPPSPLKRLLITVPSSLKSLSPAVATCLSLSVSYLLPLPSLAEEVEKAQLFDFNLTLPIIAAEFLLLMFALDKIYYTPIGNFMDERDAAIKEKLASVKDNSEEVKQLEEQANAIMRAARAEMASALNKMRKETAVEVEARLEEGKKKIEAELAEALANLEKEREESIKALDAQIVALSDEIVKKVLPVVS
ncbi:hypothetical protein Dimus_010259 [Dionaea muscipula]